MNLDQRLADAARHVAEQVDPPEVDLDAVRSTAYAGRRRTAAVALTGALALAAAVVTAALVGIPLLRDQDSTAPRPAYAVERTASRSTSGGSTCSATCRAASARRWSMFMA